MSGKLPYSASRIIKASKLLADGAKLVWLEDQIFDRGPEGAYVSAGTLAQRLGCSRETIERHRRELVQLELHRTVQRQRGETASWFCSLPADCIPSHKPGIDDVIRLADRLDAHIAGIRRERSGVNPKPSGVTTDATGNGSAPHSDATMAAILTPLPAQNREAECTSGRRTSPTSGRRTTNLLPQDGELQDGENQEGEILNEDRVFEIPDLRLENCEVKSGIPSGGRDGSGWTSLSPEAKREAYRRLAKQGTP